MGRAAASAACLVLLSGLATGCSSSRAEVDEAALTAWMDAQGESFDGGLGEMSSRVGPDDRQVMPGDGVRMSFKEPEPVSGVRLSCFGDDTLTFFVEVVQRSGTGVLTTGTEHEVPCADGSYTAEVEGPTADAVRVGAYGAEYQGAWYAVILEE